MKEIPKDRANAAIAQFFYTCNQCDVIQLSGSVTWNLGLARYNRKNSLKMFYFSKADLICVSGLKL